MSLFELNLRDSFLMIVSDKLRFCFEIEKKRRRERSEKEIERSVSCLLRSSIISDTFVNLSSFRYPYDIYALYINGISTKPLEYILALGVKVES